MNMNSMTFTYTSCENSYSYDQIKYINLGLLMGMTRSGDATGSGYAKAIPDAQVVRRDGTFGSRARELIFNCPNFDVHYWSKSRSMPTNSLSLVLKYFINFNKGLKDVGIPWFIPEDAGGCGLPVVGEKFRPSRDELRMAVKLQALHKVPSCPVDMSWFFWKNAMNKHRPMRHVLGEHHLRSYKMSLGEDDMTEENFMSQNDLWGLQVVEQFLTESNSFVADDDVIHEKNMWTERSGKAFTHKRQTEKVGTYGDYIHQLQKLWNRVRRNPAWAEFKAPDMILVTPVPTYDFAKNNNVYDVPTFLKKNVILS